MNLLKKLLKGIGIVLILFLGFILISLFSDSRRTSYLEISAHPDLETNSYLIKNVNVVPMTKDTVLKGKSVLIENGRIKQIGNQIPSNGWEEIDGENDFLSPGLVDMHVHIWDRYDLGVYLANGVTTIRNLRGFPMHLRIKEDIAEGKIVSPQLFTSGPILTGPYDLGDEKIQVQDPQMARELVREHKAKGYDCIKTYAGMPLNIFNAVLEQAEASQIEVVVHPSFEVPYGNNFQPQIATVEHAEDIVQQALSYELDTTILKSVIAQYGAGRQTLSPTLTGYSKILEMLQDDDVLNSEQVAYINPLVKKVDSKAQLERWTSEKETDPDIVERIQEQHDFHLHIVNELNRIGVNIVSGTDAGIGITAPGFSIHEELAFYLEAGMTNYGALKTATINPSKVHDKLHGIGTIQEGKKANFILTDQNPLENLKVLKSPKWVMVDGRKLEPGLMEQFKSKAKNRKGLVASALRWVEYLMVEK
ncbi:amidohydrolase family protein [Flagellimonas algicola]|uniref:Amidohydrolase family protein n=1 Tax=Flagellimonas algicola TaxID=2583815 RepID=A0ABY2WIQ3_9FLAO|nr:amidohydrolase family protein [Allomuricauda algicola]TMU54729.1 amidohydrolase family protein [Allomuricauda algicola]